MRSCLLRVAALFLLLVHAAPVRSANAPARSNIPYVPTRQDIVRDLLWLADVRTNDVVYDLGSGDGRIVIAAARDFGAQKAVGIELDPALVEQSRENARRAGVGDRVEFIHGDLFTNDTSAATVVVAYLGHSPNLKLRARLLRMQRPGTRIVSHQFGMGEWPPDKKLEVRTTFLGMYSEMYNPFATNAETPDFRVPFSRVTHATLSCWIVPARIAGVWRGEIPFGNSRAELTLTLHQRLSKLSGSFQLSGATNVGGLLWPDIWGTHVRLHASPTNLSYGSLVMWFDGHATNDTMSGKLFVVTRQGTNEVNWTCRRDPVDLTGTWVWAGERGFPAELKVNRKNGQLTATYHEPTRPTSPYEKNPPIEIDDLYDFGGGFYFTHLHGSDGVSRRQGPDDGWFIGEALRIGDALQGKVAFYPYPEDMFSRLDDVTRRTARPQNPNLKTGARSWNATLRTGK